MTCLAWLIRHIDRDYRALTAHTRRSRALADVIANAKEYR